MSRLSRRLHREVDTRLHEQIFDQSGKDRKSHTSKHSLKNNHKHVSFEDFRILRHGYTNSNSSRKYRECCLLKNYILR